ncbi:MAG TPA: TolC family protein [Telluria sp.]
MRAQCLHVLITLAAFAMPCLATAAPPPPASPGATMRDAAELAWQRSVPARTLEARRGEVEAGLSTARSWVAGAPTLGLSQRSDRWTDRGDRRESEVSLAAPLWLPGQKSAREVLAARSADDLSAQILQARLAVAGEVRSRAWEAAAAQETLAEQKDHLHHLEELAADVQRRVTAGDLARTDGLLAQQEVLASRIAVTAAATRATETLQRFRVLTGLAALPQLTPEPLSGDTAPVNLRLAAAHASGRRAQAALRLAEATRSGPPSVGVSYRHEQEGDVAGPGRSVGIALQIPLGSKARNRPVEALAQTQIATAAAEAAEAQASIDAELAVAQDRLANARTALEAATSRASALREHTALIDKAFRQGERALAEVLRSRILSHEAEIALRQQRIAVGLAHAQLNQARGILP